MVEETGITNSEDFYIGVGLAILSTVFIGTSFIVKKKALVQLQLRSCARAGEGGFGYLKDWTWWCGFLLMGAGEIANFAAYGFAPASVVTPLGALSVLVTAILASKFLHERLNLLGKLGCFLCIVGSTVIVLHSPQNDQINTLADLIAILNSPECIVFVIVIALIFLSISLYYGPHYGNKNVIVYLLVCSSIGSLSVMGCKGLSLSLRSVLTKSYEDFNYAVFFICLTLVTICISIQINYLNKALDFFSTGLVTPIYYVMFTTLVIIASSILFKEWQLMEFGDVLGSLCGFSTVIVAIVMLNVFKDVDINAAELSEKLRSKVGFVGDDTQALLTDVIS